MFDHQAVSVFSIPKVIVEAQADFNCEDQIEYLAKVSNPGSQAMMEAGSSGRLTNYLMNNSHWSPLEMVNIVLKVVTTRDISHQLIRHPTMKFQEFCVAGDTKIHTMTERGQMRKVKISKLYDRFMNKQYWDMSDRMVKIYDKNSDSLKTAKIKEVFKTGIKPVYKMTLSDGKAIVCTEDHKLMTMLGFKRLADLDKDVDFVATNGVAVYQDYDWLKHAKANAILSKSGVQGIADMANTSYHTIRKWLKIHNLKFTKSEVAEYTDIWNKGLPSDQQPKFGKLLSDETRAKISNSSKKGSESNLYSTGENANRSWRMFVADSCYKYKNRLITEQDGKCAISGKLLNINDCEVDHIEPVMFRPDLAFEYSNLQVITKEEHLKKSNAERTLRNVKCGYKKITSIKYVGKVQNYDMEIDHEDHNYVANGIVTHNSQRYAEVDTASFIVLNGRTQDTKNRQNSIDNLSKDDQDWWIGAQEMVATYAEHIYKKALELGIAKECARRILPEGMTPTTLYAVANVRTFYHYINLRSKNGTQLEHMDIAKKANVCLNEYLPNIFPLEKDTAC